MLITYRMNTIRHNAKKGEHVIMKNIYIRKLNNFTQLTSECNQKRSHANSIIIPGDIKENKSGYFY